MDLLTTWFAALALMRVADSHAEWFEQLSLLDDARAAAFVRGDPSLLDDVYTPGARARTQDARLVRRFVARGLEVDDVRFDLLALSFDRRGANRVVLRVVERLEPVRVRHDGGAWRELPRDQPTARRLTLVDTIVGWRIADVERLAG